MSKNDYNITDFQNSRLGANYDRYSKPSVSEFNDQNYNKNNYNNVYSNDSNTQLSVSQEPDIEYKKTSYYLTVSSFDRDTAVYPNGSSFIIDLPREFKNIHSIELIQAIIPDQNNVLLEPYLVLSIDELDTVMYSTNKTVSDGFAMLLLTTPPPVPGGFISIYNGIHEKTVLYYNNTPKARLARMSIKIKNCTNDIFDFGGDGGKDKIYQSTFVFKITQLERDPNSLRARSVY